jgi:hypothetical protein
LEGPHDGCNSSIHSIGWVCFDEYATHAMGEAFDAACAELQDNNLSELVREIIAERIIDVAKRGERDPKRLCSIGIAAMNGGRQTREDRPSWQRCLP